MVPSALWILSEPVRAAMTVAAMSTAFDSVCRSVSPKINRDDSVRRRLALIILRHVDEGEHDPRRLSEVALNELAGIDRSAI